MREILADAVKPSSRVRMGDALAAIYRKIDLTNEDFAVFESARQGAGQTLDLRLNDRPGYQRRFRGDEAGARCGGEGLAERPGGGNPVSVERHPGRVAVWHPGAGQAQDLLDRP